MGRGASTPNAEKDTCFDGSTGNESGRIEVDPNELSLWREGMNGGIQGIREIRETNHVRTRLILLFAVRS